MCFLLFIDQWGRYLLGWCCRDSLGHIPMAAGRGGSPSSCRPWFIKPQQMGSKCGSPAALNASLSRWLIPPSHQMSVPLRAAFRSRDAALHLIQIKLWVKIYLCCPEWGMLVAWEWGMLLASLLLPTHWQLSRQGCDPGRGDAHHCTPKPFPELVLGHSLPRWWPQHFFQAARQESCVKRQEPGDRGGAADPLCGQCLQTMVLPADARKGLGWWSSRLQVQAALRAIVAWGAGLAFIASGIASWKTPVVSHFFYLCPPLSSPACARSWGELGAPGRRAGSLGTEGSHCPVGDSVSGWVLPPLPSCSSSACWLVGGRRGCRWLCHSVPCCCRARSNHSSFCQVEEHSCV